MKTLMILWLIMFGLPASAEELHVEVRNLPMNAVLIPKSRELIKSVLYRVAKNKLIFTGEKSDIEDLRQVVAQKTLWPYFADGYQSLAPVSYSITFQVRDPLYLIETSLTLNCRSSALRRSQCGELSYYSTPACKLTPELKSQMEFALKVTSSLEDAKLLKLVTDNPCLNPRMESLYDFALKNLAHRIALGTFEGLIEMEYQAYLVSERPLEIL